MMLSLVILPPSDSIARSSSSISAHTRSPPRSMPSYVKLPVLRFASSRYSSSREYSSRRHFAMLRICSGFPHSCKIGTKEPVSICASGAEDAGMTYSVDEDAEMGRLGASALRVHGGGSAGGCYVVGIEMQGK